MEKQFMPNESPEARKKLLESQATTVSSEKYFTRLSETELAQSKSAFTKNILEMDDLEEQKKEVLDEFKERLKPLKEIHKSLSAEIRQGFREQEGVLYGFLEGNMMYFYDEKGELIDTLTRPATSDELSQRTIFMDISKTGTNN